MSDQVYQLTQLSCNMCGQSGVIPRTESYIDRFTQETITEAIWQCSRCGARFSSGIVAREKNSNETEQR
jgi:ribosomal protein L37AE/L43A